MSREQEIRERAEYQAQHPWEYHRPADVLWLLAELERERAENSFWRHLHDISTATVLLIPSDEPVPEGAKELGRKLLALYRPEVFAAAGGETG